jgi:translation initiation factor IF-2
MAKKRVHEIAKERGISSKEVLAVLQKAGLDVKAAASSVDEDDIKRAFSNGAESPKAEQPKQADAKASGDGAQASTPKQDAPKQKPAGDQPKAERQAKPESQQQGGDGGQRPQRPQRRDAGPRKAHHQIGPAGERRPVHYPGRDCW